METKAEINVTPLVDVVLVLLIIFMVVTPMINEHGIRLPQSANGKRASEQDTTKTISLAVDGSILWEQERVSPQILANLGCRNSGNVYPSRGCMCARTGG